MLYKSQLRRKKAAARLASDLRNLGRHLAERFEPQMAMVLEEGETTPDLAHLFDVVGRMLELESRGLEQVADTRGKEYSGMADARRQLRQRAEPELRSRVTWVREQMRNAYGAKEANRLLRHQGRTPRGRGDLQDLAEVMVSSLAMARPPEVKAGPTPDPAHWAKYVRPALADFNHLLRRLQRHGAQQHVIVQQRDEALADFDRIYSRMVRLVKLVYELSGQESLVKHLHYRPGRPAVGRPSEKRPAERAGKGFPEVA